jgi:hypothetical protein
MGYLEDIQLREEVRIAIREHWLLIRIYLMEASVHGVHILISILNSSRKVLCINKSALPNFSFELHQNHL